MPVRLATIEVALSRDFLQPRPYLPDNESVRFVRAVRPHQIVDHLNREVASCRAMLHGMGETSMARHTCKKVPVFVPCSELLWPKFGQFWPFLEVIDRKSADFYNVLSYLQEPETSLALFGRIGGS